MTGSVQDKHGPLYWLVAVCTATSWHLRQVRVLTELTDESTYLGVPPAFWTKGPSTHWRVPLSADHYLTDAWRLWEALAKADRRSKAHSEAARTDWRSDYDALEYEPIETPTHVINGVRGYMARLALTYAAMDFIVQPNGQWTFLEANPSGQWAWLNSPEIPLAASIAQILENWCRR